jgi:MraZ protein
VFLGRFDHAVDVKGRLALPARYRSQLDDGVVITRGFDRCLLVYPMGEWTPLAERVSALSISDPDVRALRRLLFADATDLELDKQGRVLIPAGLRNYAEIEREVVVTGMHTFIELWSPEQWSNERLALDREGQAVAERLAELI